jgi:hypothetical protein
LFESARNNSKLINMDLDLDLDFEDIDEIDENIEVIRAPKRYIRDGNNLLEFYNDLEFKKRFRFSKQSVLYGILPKIEINLIKVNNRGLPISPIMQLLICLRFYASASFQVRITLIFYIKSNIYIYIRARQAVHDPAQADLASHRIATN